MGGGMSKAGGMKTALAVLGLAAHCIEVGSEAAPEFAKVVRVAIDELLEGQEPQFELSAKPEIIFDEAKFLNGAPKAVEPEAHIPSPEPLNETVKTAWTCPTCGFINKPYHGQCQSSDCTKVLLVEPVAEDSPKPVAPPKTTPTPPGSRIAWNYKFSPEAAVIMIRQMVERDSCGKEILRELSAEMALDIVEIERLAINSHRLRIDLSAKRGIDREAAFDQILARWKARPQGVAA